jgi:oxygen-independent coproporphyrinogen III oxidase
MTHRMDFDDVVRAASARADRIDVAALRTAGIAAEGFEYYLLGTYPPLKAMHRIDEREAYENASGLYNVYVHIPFCQQYCTFCHFAKEINPDRSRVTAYLRGLRRELELLAARLPGGIVAQTVYFGGGTPSYLTARELEELLDALWAVVTPAPNCEVTFELHPRIVHDPEAATRIATVRDRGVNRWVFGVQSLNDAELRAINRGHTVAEVGELLGMLDAAGCRNVSLDLMFGLPQQTVESWYRTLQSVLDLGVTKLNIFPLMFKLTNPIATHYTKRPAEFADDRTRLLMHFVCEELLSRHGFSVGPIFYYSLTGQHSRQQTSKFTESDRVNLLPIGVSAFGYVGDTQFYNYCDIDSYLAAINEGHLPVWMGETLDMDARLRRAIMFGLRSDGVSRSACTRHYGADPLQVFAAEFQLLMALGVVELVDGDVLRLTGDGVAWADGAGALFASDQVRQRVEETNLTILNPRTDPREIHDYSPIARSKAPEPVMFVGSGSGRVRGVAPQV